MYFQKFIFIYPFLTVSNYPFQIFKPKQYIPQIRGDYSFFNYEISKDLIRKSNKFLKFIKILTGDLSDYIYDKRICKTRKKNKKELSWRVGSRIMNNFMEYYNEDCIENFGILFNSISSISTTNKLNDFVLEDLFTMLNDHIDQDTWHKIVTFKYQKINKKTNTVKEAYNPIDRCIFKSNTNPAFCRTHS